MSKVQDIKAQVLSELNSISTEQSFVDWLNGETIPAGQTCYVIFNNSFLFREDIKTVKSQKYLACKISSTKSVDFRQCYVIHGISLNMPYKIIIDNASLIKSTIIQEIITELKELGELVFIIIGEIIDNIQIRESISNADIKEIVLNPTQNNDIEFNGTTITIKDYVNEKLIWDATKQHL